jgi:hypothetical protein
MTEKHKIDRIQNLKGNQFLSPNNASPEAKQGQPQRRGQLRRLP